MEKHLDRLIEEHKELTEKINKLKRAISYYKNRKEIDNYDYGLMVAQLSHMVSYASLVEERLQRNHILIDDNGDYYEKVASGVPFRTPKESGSDFDIDTKRADKTDE